MSRVYSLKISLPYHILLLLLIAESPEVHNSNLIGCKFLFAWKLSLQVWWICCSIYGNWLERFTVPIWFTLPVHCCRTGLSLTSVFFCSSLHLCWYVSNHFPIFRLVFFAGPFVLYLLFGFALLVWPLFFLHVSCLSCVSSLSFNSMIRRIWNPLWNCHTAVVYSSGSIPSTCNTVSVFTAYSSASSHSSAVVDSIFVESPKACNSNLIGYSCHCKSCMYSVTLQWIHCTHQGSMLPNWILLYCHL